MRDLVKSFAAVAWRSVFPRRAKPTQWSVAIAAEQQDVRHGAGPIHSVYSYHAPQDLTDSFLQTAVSPPPQHPSVAAEIDGGITWQAGSADIALGVHGLAAGDDSLPLATDGAAGTGHNPCARSARQACQKDTITNVSKVSPARTEAPDLAVPQVEDDIGEQSFAAGVGLAVPHIEDGLGEQSFAAGVDLAMHQLGDGLGEQIFAAGVEQQHNSVPLEDASSVKITKVWLKWHIRKS